jgi:hypothetical protein
MNRDQWYINFKITEITQIYGESVCYAFVIITLYTILLQYY